MVTQHKNTKVVVTGMAWTTALGKSIWEVWNKLLAGYSGFSIVDSPYKLRNQLVAKIQEFSDNITPREKLHQMTLSTIRRAMKNAGIRNVNKKIILIVGTSFGARLDDRETSQNLLNEWVDKIATELGVTSVSLSTACSSASDAILIGSSLIKSGYAEICICGGADILGESKRLAHSALGTMSVTTLKSFDKNRAGTLLGEGAGFIVLENEKNTLQKRNYAVLLGCGSANDAAGLTAPNQNGKGIINSITRSLCDANLSAANINLVNAHASGTLTNDAVEMKAYEDIFNVNPPIIFATKGAFGHSLGATGALEAIALIQALNTKKVPPIHGLDELMNTTSLVFPIKNSLLHNASIGLSLTIGFGGFNTSLIFGRIA